MRRLKPPEVVDAPVPVIADDELTRLLRACAGKDYASRRDEAMLRLFLDTGVRISEMAGLDLDDVDLELNRPGSRARSQPTEGWGRASTEEVSG